MVDEQEREEVYVGVEFSKSHQISAPSDKQILRILDDQVERVDMLRKFNGGRVTKQVYLNCIVIGLEILGKELIEHAFNLGAEVFGPAIMYGEPNAPTGAGRLLKKAIAKKRASPLTEERTENARSHPVQPGVEPNIRPLPSVHLPKNGFKESKGGLKGHNEPANHGGGPRRK